MRAVRSCAVAWSANWNATWSATWGATWTLARTVACAAAFGLLLAAGQAGQARDAAAQRRPAAQDSTTEAALGETLNANTVSVVTGTPGGTYFRTGADLAFVLDDGDRLRILPILGRGAGANAYDLRFLKGVDLGFVRTDTLDQLRQDKRLKEIEKRIHYVAKLFNDELHVIAPREIGTIGDLAGKRVSFDVKGSGTDYSGRAMFRDLGLAVEAINVDQPTALEMLRRGELDAVASVAARPVAIIAGFEPAGRFHLVGVPYSERVGEAYVPATLTGADYPKLVDGAKPVETLAVGTILGVYNHPKGSERYRKLERFTTAFFDRFERFLAPQHHPKWREVNLAASVPGWTRFQPAQDWLDSHRGETPSQGEVERFLSEQPQGATADKEEVYQAYLRWRRAQRPEYGMARR